MGFNYAAEKKKFETLWARLRREYRAAGMPDAAIQKMHDFDWEVFKQERIYRLHTQDLGIGIFDEPSAEQEDKSALMKKVPGIGQPLGRLHDDGVKVRLDRGNR